MEVGCFDEMICWVVSGGLRFFWVIGIFGYVWCIGKWFFVVFCIILVVFWELGFWNFVFVWCERGNKVIIMGWKEKKCERRGFYSWGMDFYLVI